jgi:hypothetical protein
MEKSIFFAENETPGFKVVYCRYITRKGRRIYPKRAKYFRFLVPINGNSAA